MYRLLCVTAHPDDEASSFGGALLQARERGYDTFVLCMTAGEAATHRGAATNDEGLKEIRRSEFAAACTHLKVTEGIMLDYPDAKLDRQIFFEAVGDLSRWIRKLRPQVVLTFGPEGGVTAHPDHSMAGIFATAAFHWAARTNRYADQFYEGLKAHQAQKLYYATADLGLEGRQPVSLAPATTAIDVGTAYLEKKIEAFRLHQSQEPLFELFENYARKRGTRELYHLAATSTPLELRGMETDLWENVMDY
jgi:LmbE family N-acetylglucosaminyl deacetylase